MEKVKLSKAELALLDALIADMQEEKDKSTLTADLTKQSFIGGIIGGLTRVTRQATKITARITPIAARAAGQFLTGSGTGGAQGLSDLMESDGETLSVDKLIELRKAAHS